ncbi:Retrovirus-related Pol polyprotein from transposon RE1 [Vitis vinifera]|uniref:Retrovirus-related Pol polyprotein from transposon RE1 n=1 Tax=Vitis vinifera TaxID=29760 RepID=A0A438F644_VITVI|nr:Retrovirus-related Pol polyprotein from transposon RE1 [Vitis vinifera]
MELAGGLWVGLWKEISKEGLLLLNNVSFSVEDGKRVRFWKDTWCGNIPLCEAYPSLFDLAVSKDARVADCWDSMGEVGGWNPRFLRPFNDWEVERLLLIIQGKRLNADLEDRMVWNETKDGIFSIKSCFNSLDHSSAIPFPWRIIWSMFVPTKAKVLYTNDIQRLYKVASSIVNVKQQNMDLSTYIGQIASLKEEFLLMMPLTTDVGDQRTQIDKFFMVLMLIGLRPDLETVPRSDSGSSSVPSFDDVFARLLRISSTQTLPSDNTSDSSVLVSQTNSRGDAVVTEVEANVLIPPIAIRTALVIGVIITWATKSASVTSVAQTGNASACLTHTSSLGPWILDSGASDHIFGNKDLFSSITTTFALPTVTLANGSQIVAKGIGLAHPLPSVLYTPECSFNLISISKITRTLNCSITFFDKFVTLQDRSTGKTIGIGRESQGLYHLTSPLTPAVCISTDAPLLIHSRLGHPSLSKFQKMVPCFSFLSSLACESCQLGKHTHVSFPKRLNNRAKSHFELVHTNVWGPCRTASTLGFQYFVTFIDDYSRWDPSSIFLCSYSSTKWVVEYFKRVIVVIPLRLITTFSPLMSPSLRTHHSSPPESLPFFEVLPLSIISPPNAVPSRPLQVYHHRHCVAVPPSLAKIPADSLPIPSASLAPALPPSADLPIALQKGNRSTRNPHPIYNFLSYHRLSSSYSAFVSAISSISLPKSTPEALSHPVGCRWVYTIKVDPDGQVDCLKARLVAKGYTQVYGSDYGDTFSPVAKIASVRLLLSLGESGLVCRLRRSLYGLKQSPQAWFSRFSSVIQEFGMFRCTADHSVFYHHNSSRQCIYLVVYVDNIVIIGSDQNDIQKLKQHFFTHFQTEGLGKLKYFLGIKIAQSSFGVVLSQMKYALDILEETDMLNLYQDKESL